MLNVVEVKTHTYYIIGDEMLGIKKVRMLSSYIQSFLIFIVYPAQLMLISIKGIGVGIQLQIRKASINLTIRIENESAIIQSD